MDRLFDVAKPVNGSVSGFLGGQSLTDNIATATIAQAKLFGSL
jgi:hypothetical protein